MSKSAQNHIVSDDTKAKISIKNKGRKMVEERNLKIAKANTGKKFSEERKKSYSKYWNSKKGTKLSKETKLKLKGLHSGEKHPNWQGGISFIEYPKEFNNTLKNKIRERDNYCCQICNKNQSELNEKLSVHHIDYNKKNNIPENLISLCRNCHGLTNHNMEKWKMHFSLQRVYLPTFSELIDRMGISILKYIFIPEHSNEYKTEINLIQNDIDVIIKEKNIKMSSNMIYAMLINILCNRYIWENESKARLGGSEQDKLLKLTHSINGIRNTAKNVISNEIGERVDLKIDCLASELIKEFGNWQLFDNKKN